MNEGIKDKLKCNFFMNYKNKTTEKEEYSMWFDAKNVQFDAKKIQEALDKAFAIGATNRDLINSGLTGVPIEVKVPLYIIRETREEDLMAFPTPEEAEKGYNNIKEAVDNASKLSTLNNRGNFLTNFVGAFTSKGGQKSQDKEFMREMEEFADFFKKTTNITVFAVFRAKLNSYYNRENYVYLEDVWHHVWALKVEAGKYPKELRYPMGHANITDDRLRKLIEVTKAINEELKDNEGRYTWKIGITSEDSMLETCKALAENDALLDGLLEVTKDIYKKIHNKEPFNIGVPHVSYRVVEDVIALNLIKLVKKGTDVPWFSHTGETNSLVAEMLVKVDGMEERHGGNPLSLIKTVIKPFDYRVNDMAESKISSRITRDALTGKVRFEAPTSEPSTTTHTVLSDQIIMSDKFSGIKCVLTESFPYLDFESLESFDKLRAHLNKSIEYPTLTDAQRLELEKEMKAEVERDIKEEEAWHLEHGIDTTKVMVMSSDRLCREYHWSPFINRTDDIDFWTLVLPRGKDLSESFKTKYV